MSDEHDENDEQKPKTIELVIVYGTNKKLGVSDPETIEQVKEGAFGLFGIDRSELGRFVLRAKIKGEKDVQLDEAKTVEFYELHNGQKVTLASGTPFGANAATDEAAAGEDTSAPASPATAAQDATPEDEAKALARREYGLLVDQSDTYGWQTRLVDAGDYLVIFVRIVKSPERVFVLKLECDDYGTLSATSVFINPSLFQTAHQNTPGEAEFYPRGDHIDMNHGPLPRICIIGHRDYYAGGWHDGWTNPPSHQHTLYQHVVNVRNAILDTWS
jgi:hypothetical protein